MEWSPLVEFISRTVTVLLAIVGAWWAVEKWRKRDEHFPRVYFEVSVNFLGRQDGQVLVELVATLENKGLVPLEIDNLTFTLRGLKATDALTPGGPEIRGQIQFPRLLQEGTFFSSRWDATFVHPGVKTDYNFVASIPDDVTHVRMQGDFEYSVSGKSHHAAKVLKVPDPPAEPPG